MTTASGRTALGHGMGRGLYVFFLCLSLGLVAAETPRVTYSGRGVETLRWGGTSFLGEDGFGLERVVFEGADGGDDAWGLDFSAAELGEPRVQVDKAAGRVTHAYAWGRAELVLKPGPDEVGVTLTLHNTSKRAIADFRARLLEVAFDERRGGLQGGYISQEIGRASCRERVCHRV